MDGAQWKAAGDVEWPAYERNPGEVCNGAVKAATQVPVSP